MGGSISSGCISTTTTMFAGLSADAWRVMRYEDATAEVFVVVWRRLDEVPSQDQVLVWLYATARRVLANEYRRQSRAQRLVEHVAAQPAARTGVDPATSVAERAQIAAAFDELREPDREVLRLVAWEQLNTRQAAAVLECGRTTAAMRLHRARRRLLAALDRHAEATDATGEPDVSPVSLDGATNSREGAR